MGSVVSAFRLWSAGSVVVVRGLRCPAARGTLPDQGLNLCLLHWQVDSLPLSHQGGKFRLQIKGGGSTRRGGLSILGVGLHFRRTVGLPLRELVNLVLAGSLLGGCRQGCSGKEGAHGEQTLPCPGSGVLLGVDGAVWEEASHL